MEQERAGNFEQAARLAQASLEVEDSPLARLCAERNETKGGFAANLAERLIEQARTTEDPTGPFETYERLADIDEVSIGATPRARCSGTNRSSKNAPAFARSLSRLEHWLIGDGREDELEPIAGEIAKALVGNEAMAHAARCRAASYARRLLVRGASISAPCVQPRRVAALGPARDGSARGSRERCADRARSPRGGCSITPPVLSSIATLALRAADAAMRAGEPAAAKDLLVRATNAHPTHLVVQRTLAELCEQISDSRGAAEAWEAVATLSGVPEHQVARQLPRLGDLARSSEGRCSRARGARGRRSNRHHPPRRFHAAQGLYVAGGEREALASLLETRLASVTDPKSASSWRSSAAERWPRSATLPGRQSAPSRLRSRPAPITPTRCSSFRRYLRPRRRLDRRRASAHSLVRLLPDVEGAGRRFYLRLGELYDQYQPNPERAELAYREVLRRVPADINAQGAPGRCLTGARAKDAPKADRNPASAARRGRARPRPSAGAPSSSRSSTTRWLTIRKRAKLSSKRRAKSSRTMSSFSALVAAFYKRSNRPARRASAARLRSW